MKASGKDGGKVEDTPGKSVVAGAGLIKTKARDPASSKPGRRDIARYLVLIGSDEASKILQHLEEAEVEALVREISSVERIEAEEAAEVLKRFQGLVKTAKITPSSGGKDAAKAILLQAFGTVRAEQLYKQAMPKEEEPLFAWLKDLEPSQLMALLRPESAAVKSIVMASITPAQAAALLKTMSQDEQRQVISRLAVMKRIDFDVLKRIDLALKERMHEVARVITEDIDGTASIANIMKHLDPALEQSLLEILAEENPQLARDVGDRLFTVDTLLLIEDKDLQKVLSSMDDKQIALILKGKSEQIRRKILNNLSDARSLQVSQEYALQGPQPRREVDQATRDFIGVLRLLESDGRIRVMRDNEEYI